MQGVTSDLRRDMTAETIHFKMLYVERMGGYVARAAGSWWSFLWLYALEECVLRLLPRTSCPFVLVIWKPTHTWFIEIQLSLGEGWPEPSDILNNFVNWSVTHDRLICNCWYQMEVTQCLARKLLLIFLPHCACNRKRTCMTVGWAKEVYESTKKNLEMAAHVQLIPPLYVNDLTAYVFV